MRRINIRQAPHDVILARPLVDERGAFVLAAGQTLTSGVMERLWEREFRYAYIEQLGFEELEVKEPLEPQTYKRARLLARRLIQEFRETRSAPAELPVDELSELTADVCDELGNIAAGEGFLLYPGWGSRLDERLAFSLNAGVVAALVGRAIEGTTAARHLFTAALLQDVGLWRAERPQDHVSISKELLRPVRSISPLVKAIVAQHHERLDGSGYPEGRTGKDMHPLARIMSVAVAYLELISSARGPLPHEAQEALMAGAGSEFDGEAVKLLLNFVPAYPVGTVVRLSNGRQAVVINPGPPGINRPRVRLLPRQHWRVGEHPETEEELEKARAELAELDLSKEYTLTIESVLE